jgi:phosphate transport system substrate-binding protein
VIAIDGHLPTKEEVVAKKYPYARPTFYYTNGEPKGDVGKFVAFTLGAEGKKIADKVGFVPVP